MSVSTKELRNCLTELEYYLSDFEDSLAYGEQVSLSRVMLKEAYAELMKIEERCCDI